MTDFKKKTLKYLVVLLVLYLGINLYSFFITFFMRDIENLFQITDPNVTFRLTIITSRIIFGSIFGIILYHDCRNEIKNKYLVPGLGAIVPIVGTMFYFIEKYSASKLSYNEN